MRILMTENTVAVITCDLGFFFSVRLKVDIFLHRTETESTGRMFMFSS